MKIFASWSSAATPFLGTLNILGDLNVDLHFMGNANRINITGFVNNDIDIDGSLTFLTSGNIFDQSSGDFLDGVGNTLGALTVGSGGTAGKVSPSQP